MNHPLRTGIAALLATLICAAPSWAAKAGSAHLTLVENSVSVAGHAGTKGTGVSAGETIVTGPHSRAEVTLADGTVVRIGQGSSFTFTGSKLVLNQGSALIRVAHKGTTLVSGSRTYTGGPAVVSAQASKSYDGLFVLQGAGSVNGQSLIAGETSVLEKGKDRKFSFDLQKMVSTSTLVTKFPTTPWTAQTAALASVQHQLLTAKIVPANQAVNRGQQNAVANAHSGLVSSRASTPLVSQTVANLVSTGRAGALTASRGGNAAGVTGGTLSVSGATVSLGSSSTATMNLTNSSASLTKTGAGTLQISGANTVAAGGTTLSAGTLTLNSAVSLNTITGSLASAGNTATNVVTSGTTTLINPTTVGNAGVINTNAGTVASTGTLILSNPRILTIVNGTNFNGVSITKVGQSVTVGGVNYITTSVTNGGSSFLLQPVTH